MMTNNNGHVYSKLWFCVLNMIQLKTPSKIIINKNIIFLKEAYIQINTFLLNIYTITINYKILNYNVTIIFMIIFHKIFDINIFMFKQNHPFV